MPLSVTERIEFYLKEAAVSLQTLETVDTVALVNINLGCAFTERMVAAMTVWRHDLGDPTPLLQKVSDVFRLAPERLAVHVQPHDMWEYYSFEEQPFIDILLGEELHLSRYENLATCERVGKDLFHFFERLLRWCLLVLMQDETLPPCWETVRDYVARKKRYKLLYQTAENHVLLVQSAIAGDDEGVIEAVHQGERLFAKRKKSAFYSGGSQLAGGGPDNDHSVDFVLAAVLVHCRRRYGADRIPDVETIHDWRW